MQDLNIALIQTALHWENKQANLDMFTKLLDGVNQPADIVLLPEMFSTGFSMQAEKLAEDMNGSTLLWMKAQAAQRQIVLCGSFICVAEGRYYNRLVWMQPDGACFIYDKRHLFRMGEENKHYSAGTKQLLVEYKGWKIVPLICYDLRFPVWCRHPEANLVLFVANWPERRSAHWKALLQARAIENQCYVAAVNRVGEDGNAVYHSGDSMMIDARGEVLFHKAHDACIYQQTLSAQALLEYRKSFQAWKDADAFSIVS